MISTSIALVSLATEAAADCRDVAESRSAWTICTLDRPSAARSFSVLVGVRAVPMTVLDGLAEICLMNSYCDFH